MKTNLPALANHKELALSLIRIGAALVLVASVSCSGLCQVRADEVFEMLESRRFERLEEITEEGEEADRRRSIDIAEITTEWTPQPTSAKDHKLYSVLCKRMVITTERGTTHETWDSSSKMAIPDRYLKFEVLLVDPQVVRVDSTGGFSVSQLGPETSEIAKYRSEVLQSRRNFAEKPKLSVDDIAAFDKESEDAMKRFVEFSMLPPTVFRNNESQEWEIRNCQFPQEFHKGYNIGFKPKPMEEGSDVVGFSFELTQKLASDPFTRRSIEKSNGAVKVVRSRNTFLPATGEFVANFVMLASPQGFISTNRINLNADVRWSIKKNMKNDK